MVQILSALLKQCKKVVDDASDFVEVVFLGEDRKSHILPQLPELLLALLPIGMLDKGAS